MQNFRTYQEKTTKNTLFFKLIINWFCFLLFRLSAVHSQSSFICTFRLHLHLKQTVKMKYKPKTVSRKQNTHNYTPYITQPNIRTDEQHCVLLVRFKEYTAQHILQTSRKQINSIYFLKRKYQVICFDTHLYRTLYVRIGFMAYFFHTQTLLWLHFARSLRFYIYN